MAEEFNKEEYIESQIMNIIANSSLSVNDEEKIEIVNNFKKLQEINPGINPNQFQGYYQAENGKIYFLSLLQSPLFEKLGPQFICDILEYHGSAIYNTIKHSEDELLGELINYLKENNLYSTKIINKIMSYYDDCKTLMNNLITANSKLSDLEKENLILYLDALEKNKKISAENKIDFVLSNKVDLTNFKDRYIEYIYSLFDKNTKYNMLQEIILISLFGKNYTYNSEYENIFGNNYLIDIIKEQERIDVFDEAIVEIIKDIKSYSVSDEDRKQKYRNIVKKHISIVNRISKIQNEINKLNENRVNEILSNGQFKNSKISIKEYNGKKVKVMDIDGEKFNLLIHGIKRGGGQDESGVGEVARELYQDPSIWNGIDHSSTISCSFISDKYQGRAGTSDDTLYYGFNNLPRDEIFVMANTDAGTEWGENRYFHQEIHNNNPNRIIKQTNNVELQKDGKMYLYNETAIYRKNKNVNRSNKKVQPSYIVSFSDKPTENELKHAAYFGIPIVHIDEQKYAKINEEKTEKYKSGNLDTFTIEDAREILHLKSFTEEESINLIMQYLDNCNLAEEDYNNIVQQIRNEFINYFIDNKEDIDNALNILNQHVNNYSKESVNNGFTK